MQDSNEFGEIPRNWSQENLGITPEFALEKMGDGFVEIVRLVIAGDHLNEPVLIVDDKVRERFADEYERWKNGGTDPRTSLKAWGVLNDKQIAELERQNVGHVETIAALSDANVHILGPNPQRTRERAIAFLANSGDSQRLRELEASNRAMKTELVELRALVKAKTKVSK
jgi:hypothetical protein